jgi:hypothetical protein
MDSFRAAVRGQPPTKAWFELADDLNWLGLDILNGHMTPLDDNQRLLIAAFFVRVHKSFQAALILAERGLTGDANAVLRSAVETAIALNALANDPAFVNELIGAHRLNQQKLAGVVLNNPDYRASYPPDEIAQMEATISDVDGLKADSATKPLKIIWADVAQKNGCRDLYQLLYRLLSTNGTHTNVDAANNQFEIDSAGRITGLKVRPDYDGLAETLKAACLTLLSAADPFLRAFPKDGFTERIQAGMVRVRELIN